MREGPVRSSVGELMGRREAEMCKYEQSYFSEAMHVREPELDLGSLCLKSKKQTCLVFLT